MRARWIRTFVLSAASIAAGIVAVRLVLVDALGLSTAMSVSVSVTLALLWTLVLRDRVGR